MISVGALVGYPIDTCQNANLLTHPNNICDEKITIVMYNLNDNSFLWLPLKCQERMVTLTETHIHSFIHRRL
jgi:hypothetical protein